MTEKIIEIIETGVDVSRILDDLKKHPEGWNAGMKAKGAQSMLTRGFPVIEAGVLQLVVGGVTNINEYVGDTEFCIPTKEIHDHPAVVEFMLKRFGRFNRCGFLSLPVGGKVGTHIDVGEYYKTKDRYHLSIQGRYKYHVGDVEIIVEPGTLFRFNNKLPHGAENIGDEVRITFVFDVAASEHFKNNQE